MGGFYGSTHVRTDQFDRVREVVERVAREKKFACLLSPVINGWVGIYNDQYGQIPLGEELARYFREDVLSMLVHDDDVFCYWYFRDGMLVDQYNSCPDYFGEEEAGDWSGHPERLGPLVDDLAKLEALEKIVHPEPGEPQRLEPEVAQQVKMSTQLSSNIEDLLSHPEKLIAFGMENKIPFPPQLSMVVRQMTEEGKSLEEIQRAVMERPELMQNYFVSIVQLFMQQTQAEMESHPPVLDEEDYSIPSRGYLFASHQMTEFAGLLGIPNVPNAYEYLLQGETDFTERWEEFVEIGAK